VPDDGAPRNQMGTPVASNTTFQYHLFDYLWPEVELNYTWYPNGEHEGLNQLFVTPGLVLGKFKIHDRFGFTIGAGTQIAVTDTPTYNRNIILTARFPF
jgi:opacity protein-like surface antigen